MPQMKAIKLLLFSKIKFLSYTTLSLHYICKDISFFKNNHDSHGAFVFGRMVPYEPNRNVRKIRTVEGYMFYSPYSFEENRFYFFEACRIFENVVQNVSQTDVNQFEIKYNLYEMRENLFETEENLMPVDVKPAPSNPFRAKSSYFKQSESAAEKLESLLNDFYLHNSTRRTTKRGENESNWLLKYIVDLLSQMRKEHDQLSFKVKLLSQENRIFSNEINNLKFKMYKRSS